MNWLMIVLPLSSFLAAVAATWVVRRMAIQHDIVCRPRADRWSQRTVALLGGIGIFVGTIVAWLLSGLWTSDVLLVMTGATILFVTGLVDDFASLKPYQKLIAQLLAAILLPAFGLLLPWTGLAWIDLAITLLWLIGITNAVNLLDNMDGLAAGIGAIASCFMGYLFITSAQYTEATLMFSFAAVLLGFLVFNWNPASIFMGDCGSMLIGYFMSGMSLLYVAAGRSRSFLPVIAVPVLTLLLPIFDTSIVSLVRKLSGRKISTGGRDHTSHRLVALGLSEKRAVTLLYGLAIASGLLGVCVSRINIIQSLTALLAFVIGLTLLGVYLGRVKVYDDQEVRAAREQPVIGFLFNVSQKQPVFEVLLDFALIALAFQLAVLFHDDGLIQGQRWGSYVNFMLLLVEITLPVFLIFGLYREVWRFVSIHSAFLVLKAVTVSGVLAAIMVMVCHFPEGITVSLVVVESVLLFSLILGSRMTFRALRQLLIDMRMPHEPRRRTVIFGAGDAGDLLCRELRNNRESEYAPIAFVDDDQLKCGRNIHGLPVHDGNGSLASFLRDNDVSDLIVSTSNVDDGRLAELRQTCEEAGVRVQRMRFEIEDCCDETHLNGQPELVQKKTLN